MLQEESEYDSNWIGKLYIYAFLTIYSRPTNLSKTKRKTCLKFSLKLSTKCENKKMHCFLKSYRLHLLQRVLNAIEKLKWKPLACLFCKDFRSNKKN